VRLPDELRGMHILVVDDEPLNVELVSRMLHWAGFNNIETTNSSVDALERCAARRPDLLILDLLMPELDGFNVMAALGPGIRAFCGPSVLMLTADSSVGTRRRALEAGAQDFVVKPFDRDEVLLRTRGILERRHLQRELLRQNARLEEAVLSRTQELEASRIEVLDRLTLIAEYRDQETNHHARRIGRLAFLFASLIDFSADDLDLLEEAAALHDIGKIAVPDAILRKRGPLTPDEMMVMRTHTTAGSRTLAGSRSPVLQLAERIALTHHERWDGTGYPRGLMGSSIPLEGRVVAVADVFDALTHERPYKHAWSAQAAAAEIAAGAGTQFDPTVVDAFQSMDLATAFNPLEEDLLVPI